MNKALHSFTGRAARRLRRLRRRLAGVQRAARRAAVLGCVAASTLGISASAFGQMGQAPMAASGRFVNRAVQGLQGINLNGQGRLYYGINAADRGLGYQGSYMTLGGYFPAVEDDLGGLWAADVRSHLSNYGGFFSNVGAVRKQLLGGGSLLGVGVYWDYDGDQNQYEDQVIGTIDPVIFPGGFSYNQVGISGELLTDWGNIRSNGYIPLGSTGQSTGHFASTNILCVQGINAALGGADLEVGAYVPALADWAGMINVGGYTYGNTLYQLDTGADLVPFFGGVFTRIDLTFADNWDFSLQYNNDSYFDSTGFARLTYRLGGSRRRNVPDQLEQPMMRNEHIVRAHQEALVAINPRTGEPWRVVHVDNSATGPGTGSLTNPVPSLTAAEAVATAQYDIVFVHQGGAAYSNSGGSPLFTFQNSDQYLIGQGSAQTIPTLTCGDILVSTTIDPTAYPTLQPRPNETAILIPADFPPPPGTTPRPPNASVSGFIINASGTGIESLANGGTNTIDDVVISGGLTGIDISGTSDHVISNLGFQGQNGIGLLNNGSGTIQLTSADFTNVAGTSIETNAGVVTASDITISDTAGNGIIVGGTKQASLQLTDAIIQNSQQSGIVNSGDGSIQASSTSITGSTDNGIRTTSASTGTVLLTNSTIDGDLSNGGVASTAVLMEGTAQVSLTNTNIESATTGIRVTGNAQYGMTGGRIVSIVEDAVSLNPLAPTASDDGSASFDGVVVSTIGRNGISTQGVAGQGGSVSFVNSTMSTIGGTGIVGTGIGQTQSGSGAQIYLQSSNILNATDAGIEITDSNLRVISSRLASVGDVGISSIDASTVLVANSTIAGNTATGIQAEARDTLSFSGGVATGFFNNLTATNNAITTDTDGIILQGAIELVNPAVRPAVITSQGVVNSRITGNSITATTPISLVTDNGITGVSAATGDFTPDVTGGLTGPNGRPQGIQVSAINRSSLEAINFGADVTEAPAAGGSENITTTINYLPGLIPPVPTGTP